LARQGRAPGLSRRGKRTAASGMKSSVLVSGTVGWERGFHRASIEKIDVFSRRWSVFEGFAKLEEAALSDGCLRFPDDKTALMAQLTTAKVRSRENTGVGFYTRIAVERESSAALKGERMRSGGWAHIDGFDNPWALFSG
jgi:hypothetical protein